MSKKDIIFGITTGLISNIIGVIFTVIFLFQEISISNIFRIINESIDNNFITKLISLRSIVNLIAFFIFLKFNYVERARGFLIVTFLVAILTIYINNF